MPYLIDEDLDTAVAEIARGLGLDAANVQELGRRRWSDEQHLVQAAEEGRCIVTGNRDDFLRLTARFAAGGRPHAGVIVVPYTLIRRGAAAMAYALAAFDRARGDFSSEYLVDFLSHPDLA
jgi:hypothetical protein